VSIFVLSFDRSCSGLDSTSAVALIKLLQNLARTQGKTVITSIHQPNSALFRSFDKLLLLAEGQVVYFGTPKKSLIYLQQQNLVCPDGYNAADHWMDLLVSDSSIEEEHEILNGTTAYDNLGTTDHTNASIEPPQPAVPLVDDSGAAMKHPKLHKKKSAFTIRKERTNNTNNNQDATSPASHTTRQQLIEAWDGEAVAEQLDLVVRSMAVESTNSDVAAMAATEEEKARKANKYSTSWWTQYRILTHRAMKNSRSAIFTPLNLVKSALLGLVCGLVWFRLEYTEAKVGDINSYCFFTMTFWTFDAMFGALMAFPAERQVILKVRIE
jgi:ABC-type multidrug transport system ATPase subunit